MKVHRFPVPDFEGYAVKIDCNNGEFFFATDECDAVLVYPTLEGAGFLIDEIVNEEVKRSDCQIVKVKIFEEMKTPAKTA